MRTPPRGSLQPGAQLPPGAGGAGAQGADQAGWCAPCGALVRLIQRCSARPGDTPADRRLKTLAALLYMGLGAIATIVAVRGSWHTRGVWWAGACIAMVAMNGSLALTLFSSIPPRTVCCGNIAAMTLSIILMDWEIATYFYPRAWSFAVLATDFAIVADAPGCVTDAVMYTVVLFLVCERAEAGFRFGMYDLVRRIAVSDSDGVLWQCSDPPCALGAYEAASSFVGIVLVFATDLHLTRGFATGLRRQMRMIDATVAVSERIATLLAEYSIDGARRVVDARGDSLPPALRAAYERLLFNLVQYRPYLPDSLFPEQDGGLAQPDALLGSTQSDVAAPGLGDPSPRVAICFTDIQQSTGLWEAHPRGMYEALQVHNALVRRLAAAHSGYEVKTIGDSFMLAFGCPVRACNFSLSLQKALLEQEWSGELTRHPLCAKQHAPDGRLLWHGLRVRAGVHCGAVHLESNPVTGRCDYYGPVVNTAARVEGAVRLGGLVGVTGTVLQELGGGGMQSIGAPLVRSIGPRELRGVRDPVEVFLLVPQELGERRSACDYGPDDCEQVLCQPVQCDSAPESPVTSVMRSSAAVTPQHTSFAGSEWGMSREPSVGSARLLLVLRRSVATCATVRAELCGLEPVDARIAGFAAAVEQAGDASQGVVTAVLSATVSVTWNALVPCRSHTAQFQHFLFGVQRDVLSRAPCRVGAATGAVLSGNVAAGRRRFATVIGGPVELSAALAEEAELCGDTGLAAGPAAEHCAALRTAFRAQIWRPTRRQGSLIPPSAALGVPITVWSIVLQVGGGGGGKWDSLLNLDRDNDAGAPDAALDEALLAAATGSGGAGAMLQELRVQYPEDDRVARLQARVASGTVLLRAMPPLWEPSARTTESIDHWASRSPTAGS